MYKGMEVQGNKAIISFDNAPTGLVAKDKTVTEVYVAGADKIFYPADAKIDLNKLVVHKQAGCTTDCCSFYSTIRQWPTCSAKKVCQLILSEQITGIWIEVKRE